MQVSEALSVFESTYPSLEICFGHQHHSQSLDTLLVFGFELIEYVSCIAGSSASNQGQTDRVYTEGCVG